MNREVRKQQRLESTKQGILEAAQRVFAQKGVESATLHDIAEEAGYTPSALYKYFASKEDILEAALGQMMDLSFESLSSPQRDDETFRAYFERLALEQFRLAEANREFLSFLVYLRSSGPHQGCLSPEQFDRGMKRTAEILAEGIRQGAIRKMDPTLAAHFVHGVERSMMLHRYAAKDPSTIEEATSEFCQLVFGGLSCDVASRQEVGS